MARQRVFAFCGRPERGYMRFVEGFRQMIDVRKMEAGSQYAGLLLQKHRRKNRGVMTEENALRKQSNLTVRAQVELSNSVRTKGESGARRVWTSLTRHGGGISAVETLRDRGAPSSHSNLSKAISYEDSADCSSELRKGVKYGVLVPPQN